MYIIYLLNKLQENGYLQKFLFASTFILLHIETLLLFISLLIALYIGLDVIFFRGFGNYSGSGSNLNNT